MNITIEQMNKIDLVIASFSDDQDRLTKEIINILGAGDLLLEEGELLLSEFNKEIENKDWELVNIFSYAGKEWGFIPNLSKIKTNEFIDLDYWISNGNMEKVLSILYRPITERVGDTYDIEPYEGTDKYSELLKGADWRVYKGAMVFFYHLRASLLDAISIYTQQEMKKTMKWSKIKELKTSLYKCISTKNILGIKCFTTQHQKTT